LAYHKSETRALGADVVNIEPVSAAETSFTGANLQGTSVEDRPDQPLSESLP
jgi:hypothetical protein